MQQRHKGQNAQKEDAQGSEELGAPRINTLGLKGLRVRV